MDKKNEKIYTTYAINYNVPLCQDQIQTLLVICNKFR